MDVRVGDILVMKKNHPCGENRFLVLRSGMDFKLRCTGCGREVMVARSKAEKKHPANRATVNQKILSEIDDHRTQFVF